MIKQRRVLKRFWARALITPDDILLISEARERGCPVELVGPGGKIGTLTMLASSGNAMLRWLVREYPEEFEIEGGKKDAT